MLALPLARCGRGRDSRGSDHALSSLRCSLSYGPWVLAPAAACRSQLPTRPCARDGESGHKHTNEPAYPYPTLYKDFVIRDSDSLAIRVPTCMILYSCEGSVLFYTSTLPTNNGYSDAYLETGHADETSERPGAATRH